MTAPPKKPARRRAQAKPQPADPDPFQTATGTSPGNIDGLAIAITVFSTVKRWGDAKLRLVFLMPKLLPYRSITLKQLSFIHFARWSVVRELADNGQPAPHRKLNHPHLYFESNFNGGWEEYIDAFSHVLTDKMIQLWGTSYGFPGPQPTEPFKQYIKHSERRLEASHFYSAYPDATVTMITQALKLDDQLSGLKAIADDLTPEKFATAFTQAVKEGQRCF